MKWLIVAFFLFAYPVTLGAQAPNVDECVRRGDIYSNADYRDPLPALRQVVAEKARRNRNTFYVSPICYFDTGTSDAMVYWRQGRALILWEPRSKGDDPLQRRNELVWSRRFLKLDRDVVPTDKEVAGSNYLITKKTARRMIRDCMRNGRKFVLYKRRPLH